MSIDELKYWLSLAKISEIGPIRWQKILNYFPNLSEFWIASFNEIIRSGIEPKLAEIIIIRRKEIEPETELEKVRKLGIEVITIRDQNYPRLLKEIYSFPPLLYVRGKLDLNNNFPLAVVGTRKITGYGQQAAQEIVSRLGAAGLTIISGLALGIDACAHQAALDGGGKTIAVLGSGLDQIYPAANRKLAREITENNGAVISEFPPGTIPYKSNFPLRNRLISGLSLGTLVIEAGEKSGALITARYALEQNREVFAVPGSIYSAMSVGSNELIKLGAKTVTSGEDILQTLNLYSARVFTEAKAVIPENETESLILEKLDFEPLHIDRLAAAAAINISQINAALAVMEMKGLVKNLGGQIYARVR
jgi:DNA processing protein